MVVVTLHRLHSYGSLDDVKSEIADTAVQFAQSQAQGKGNKQVGLVGDKQVGLVGDKQVGLVGDKQVGLVGDKQVGLVGDKQVGLVGDKQVGLVGDYVLICNSPLVCLLSCSALIQ